MVGGDRNAEFQKLEAAARDRLLLIDNELYFDVGVPFYRVRFTDQSLMISVAFGQSIIKKPFVPSIDARAKPIDIEIGNLDEVELIAQDWEQETGQKADWRVIATEEQPPSSRASSSKKTDILKEAKAVLVSEAASMSSWKRTRIEKWLDLRDAVEAAEKDTAAESYYDKLADLLLGYGNDFELEPSLSASNFARLTPISRFQSKHISYRILIIVFYCQFIRYVVSSCMI